jgi:hypothetical protein
LRPFSGQEISAESLEDNIVSKKVLSFENIVGRSIVVRFDPPEAEPGLYDEQVAKGSDIATDLFVGQAAGPIDDILRDVNKTELLLDALNLELGNEPVAAFKTFKGPYKDPAYVPEALRGVAGIGVTPFVEVASVRMDNPNSQLRVKVGGKICDHIFIPQDDPNNPSDCPNRGRGHLSVEVLHEFFESDDDLRACKPNKTEFYHWDIEICEYEVHRRYDLIEEYKDLHHLHFPNDPFPTVLDELPFPAPALDSNDPRSIWCRGLNHKLYAKGRNVKVERVYRQVCHHSPDTNAIDEDFHLLDRSDPNNAMYYAESEDACVDIMFKGYPTLAGVPDDVRGYCLGRCKKPEIVNTGA